MTVNNQVGIVGNPYKGLMAPKGASGACCRPAFAQAGPESKVLG